MPPLKLIDPEDRPRERLLRSGGNSLSDAELVAVLLRTGRQGQSAVEMAKELLEERGGLAGLLATPRSALRRKGLADAKLATLLAAFELGRRLARCRVDHRDLLARPATVANYLVVHYQTVDQEVMGALFLDIRNRLIADRELFRGTLSRAAVEPRAILKEALALGAASIVLFHTHPSGDPAPSAEDIDFTKRMVKASELLGIRLMDHMIIGAGGSWVSLRLHEPW
jgi:DNA repair protein RadC